MKDNLEHYRYESDDNPARGILVGLGISILMWAVMIGVAAWFLR